MNISFQNGLYFLFGISFAVIFFVAGMSYASSFTRQNTLEPSIDQPYFIDGEILSAQNLNNLSDMIEVLSLRTQWMEADSSQTAITSVLNIDNIGNIALFDTTSGSESISFQKPVKIDHWTLEVPVSSDDLHFTYNDPNIEGEEKMLRFKTDGTIGSGVSETIVVYQ